MRKLKIFLIISLVLNLLFLTVGSFVVYKKGGIKFVEDQLQTVFAPQEYSSYYLQQKDIFESLKNKNADKIFIGDSLIEHGEFQEYFPDEVVLNRGISGDESKGVLNRIIETVNRQPKEVYVMIGVNDIFYSRGIEDFEDNVTNIVKSFNSKTSNIYLQSILPVNNAIYGIPINNETINQFNEVLQKIAKENGIEYIDLHSKFTDKAGQLDEKFTIDGLHITGDGYRVWVETLNQ